MTRDELLAVLAECQSLSAGRRADGADPEAAHARADEALIEYINDPEVTAAFEAIVRWYS